LCEQSIVTAIERNATTGQTHEVPLEAVDDLVTVSNPAESEAAADAGLWLNVSDPEVSSRAIPLPSTTAADPSAPAAPPPEPPDTNTTTTTTFGVQEKIPLSATVVGATAAIGSSVLVGLLSVVYVVAV